MRSLSVQIRETLTLSMTLPEPLERLFAWIEENRFFIDREEGRVGFLYPDEKLREE